VKDSTVTAFGRSILVWPTPGLPSHQKHGTLLRWMISQIADVY
jgi:hypothetical protein